MKKLIRLFIFTMVIVILLTGCTNAATNKDDVADVDNVETINYDSITLERAEQVTDETGFDFYSNPFSDGSRYFKVEKKSENDFLVDVNGSKMEVQTPNEQSSSEEYHPINVSNISSKYTKIVETSKQLVFKYIDSSTVLKDKEDIKEYIENLPAKEASFTEEDDVGAFFSDTDNCIYINRNNSDLICEWMVVHELIHVISFYTHGCCMEDEEFAYNLFNEILTDILTSSMNPKILQGVQSGYSMYYGLLYPYINLFGKEAIHAYFYGYDDIYNQVGKTEFEFFVLVIENYGVENSNVYYNNLIYKWYSK